MALAQGAGGHALPAAARSAGDRAFPAIRAEPPGRRREDGIRGGDPAGRAALRADAPAIAEPRTERDRFHRPLLGQRYHAGGAGPGGISHYGPDQPPAPSGGGESPLGGDRGPA